MAWIRVLDEDEVKDEPRHAKLARLYRGCLDPEHGVVDNILKIHSLRPETLEGHLRLYRAAMHPHPTEGLSRRERELLGVAVSACNACHY